MRPTKAEEQVNHFYLKTTSFFFRFNEIFYGDTLKKPIGTKKRFRRENRNRLVRYYFRLSVGSRKNTYCMDKYQLSNEYITKLLQHICWTS